MGVRGHILNRGKIATNTCIIMIRISLTKPGNPASNEIIPQISHSSKELTALQANSSFSERH